MVDCLKAKEEKPQTSKMFPFLFVSLSDMPAAPAPAGVIVVHKVAVVDSVGMVTAVVVALAVAVNVIANIVASAIVVTLIIIVVVDLLLVVFLLFIQ